MPMSSETQPRVAPFDLAALEREMRGEAAYARDGHTARSLVRLDDLRVLLVVAKAGSRIAEHRAKETATLHLLSGTVRLRLPERSVELQSGGFLALKAELRHDVEALADSAFVLTLGRRGSD